MKRKDWSTIGLMAIFILFCHSVYAQEVNFIQPCPDAGGYYGWLGGPNKNHLAHDYNAPEGTKVKAISDGTVWATYTNISGFGSEGKPGPAIWIKHRLANAKYFYALYGHVEPTSDLRKGYKVKRAQIIGTIIRYLDKKTKEDRSHLHFGIWNSESEPPLSKMGYGPIRHFTDPIKFLNENRPEVPDSKAVSSHELFQIGDFSFALSSVNREKDTANLQFIITKIKNTGFEREPITIILTDDHGNNYRGSLEISPYTDFPLHLLPIEFSYMNTASIRMPQAAPIAMIQIGDLGQIKFQEIEQVKPDFEANVGDALLKPGESISVGKFLLFTVEDITQNLFDLIVSVTVENRDYNELEGKVECALQDADGKIIKTRDFQKVAVSGLTKKTARLTFKPIHKTPSLRMLLIFYRDPSSDQTVLKFWPIDAEKFAQNIEEHFAALRLQMVDRFQKRFDASESQWQKERAITDQQVLAALRKVPRHEFVSYDQWERAYEDYPIQVIGGGSEGVTLQPYTVAYMIQALRLKHDEKVLMVGTRSGYGAAILAETVDSDRIFCVEIYQELAQHAMQALKRLGYGKVKVKIRDSYFEWKEYAPFDAIIVTVATSEIPQSLVDQLGEGGRMIIRVRRRLILIEKQMGKVIQKALPPLM